MHDIDIKEIWKEIPGLYWDISFRSGWVTYACLWLEVALGLTLLSFIGYFHTFSRLYSLVCGRYMVCLWGAVPGLIIAILSIPWMSRHRSKWGDGLVTIAVIVLLWQLGGYVKSYRWMSGYYYVGRSACVYHLVDDCRGRHGGVEEMQGCDVAAQGYELCGECEALLEEAGDVPHIPSRYQ